MITDCFVMKDVTTKRPNFGSMAKWLELGRL